MRSRAKIDTAGRALARGQFVSVDQEIEAEIFFDEYRQAHLQPLTEATHLVQDWLSSFGKPFYIAQRLKRRPQILRKLRRFSVRLTQLQDIGGNRVIVDANADVDALHRFIAGKLHNTADLRLHRVTDYRVVGRDDTGYRALHLILQHGDVKVELQVRSRAQHHWAEAIERTSVVYGHHLKENEGDQVVIQYFKSLSQVFYQLESGREPSPKEKMNLDEERERAEAIIEGTRGGKLLYSRVNDSILHTLTAVEQSRRALITNWLLIFDWNSGEFVNWEQVPRDPQEAYAAYNRAEMQYSADGGCEVVLVGSSDVSMIRRTHSHYFGIDGYDAVLESLEESVVGFSARKPLPNEARRVLHTLYRKKFWSRNTVSFETLSNHYCKSVRDLAGALRALESLGLVEIGGRRGPISLQSSKREDIESYL